MTKQVRINNYFKNQFRADILNLLKTPNYEAGAPASFR